MKNKTRLGFLVLSVLFAMSVRVPGIFAEEMQQIAVDPALLHIVGVFDDTDISRAVSTNEVTRGEAVYYALRLVGYDRATMDSAYETYYTDVPADHPYGGAICLAQNLKIVSPADRFDPDDKVTAEQLIRMVVAAMGYDPYALFNGGYPTGYFQIASRADLLNGFVPSGTDTVRFCDMTVLLDNALRSEVMRQVSAGDLIQFETKEGVTVLSEIYHIYERKGQITQNAVTSLTASEELGENRIRIGNTVYQVSDTALYSQLSKYLGYEITAFVKEEDSFSWPTVVYFEVSDQNNVITIFSEDFVNYGDGKIDYISNGNARSINIPRDAYVLYNGKALEEELEGDVFASSWGEINIIENTYLDSKIVSVLSYENYVASAIDTENYIVYDKTVTGRKIDFKKDGELSPNAFFHSKTGETLSFDNIIQDCVLSVAASRDNDCFDVYIVTETVSGILSSIYYEEISDGVNRVDEVIIDANLYEIAPNLYSVASEQFHLGDTYTFGLDAGGRIASIELTKSASGGMVFLIDATLEDATFDSELQFRILNNNGTVSVLKAADRIEIDGQQYRTESYQNVIAVLSANSEGIRSQVVDIEVNDSSEVTAIDTAFLESGEDEKNSLQIISDENRAIRYKANPKMFESLFGISTDVKVFFYPTGTETSSQKGADNQYSVGNSSYFTNDGTYTMTAYAYDRESPKANAIAIEGSKASGISSQQYLMVVTEVVETLNEDGVEVIAMRGLYNGGEITLYLEDASVLQVSAETGQIPSGEGEEIFQVDIGDSIRYGQNSEEYVDEIRVFYDYSENRSYADNEQMDVQNIFQVVCGDLYRVNDGYITLCKNINESPGADESLNPHRHFNASGFKVYVVNPSFRGEPEITVGNIQSLKDYYTYAEDCSRVLLQMRYYDPRTMVIYQK